MDRTLVIGDCHSNLAALKLLLKQEGIVDDHDERVGRTRVIQLGDLGDFRLWSRDHDEEIFRFARHYVDVFLRGNHEEPVWAGPAFGGYASPHSSTRDVMNSLVDQGRMVLATSAHGFLITHAGLGDVFPNRTGSLDRKDPARIAAWINRKSNEHPHKFSTPKTWNVRDSISMYRGGYDEHGGILWRDSREALYSGVRQIFGHTSHELAVQIDDSYCIDTSKYDSISAIMLPEERVIRVTSPS